MTFRYQSELLDYKTHLKQSMSEFNIPHYFYLFIFIAFVKLVYRN